ncbi:MAG TPA: biotin/lipoyl-containing protein, partial [Actinomycetes bacterium]|nr:biotin/lipoyl-containing protein [Actinomycetes bacterium]
MAEREFKLPDLGEGLTDGEVVRWLVAEGDAIELNQPIVEIETAKAVVEIPAPYAGTVVKLHATEGDSLDVGAPLISVDTAEGAAPAAVAAEAEPEQELQATLVGPGERQQVRRRRIGHTRGSGPAVDNREHAQSGSLQAAPAQRPRATPPVRRYAKDRGVDLAALVGTGRDGRITREDVDGALDGSQDGARNGAQPAAGRPRDRGEER